MSHVLVSIIQVLGHRVDETPEQIVDDRASVRDGEQGGELEVIFFLNSHHFIKSDDKNKIS